MSSLRSSSPKSPSRRWASSITPSTRPSAWMAAAHASCDSRAMPSCATLRAMARSVAVPRAPCSASSPLSSSTSSAAPPAAFASSMARDSATSSSWAASPACDSSRSTV
ncbi:MAG TPA: hypothetical protein VLW85_16840 [Myxococcales bacterium]|nr:hypothetical protein [Myxococcales bacterium]